MEEAGAAARGAQCSEEIGGEWATMACGAV
jgi:hypothetical protein